MKRALQVILGLVALAAAYLLLWPSVDAVAWTPPPAGDFVPTGGLAGITRVPLPFAFGPEDLEVDREGRIYAGLADGSILRFAADGAHEVLANTGGRPLGLHWDNDGNLLIADAYKGLLRMKPAVGPPEVLATTCGDKPLVFTDDLETTRDGRVWFTDASVVYDQHRWKADIMESRPHGRLCVYDPRDKIAREVVSELYFANGVAVDPEERFVLVNETSRYRVRRYWLQGEKAGKIEPFIELLPGFPDGISTGTDGIFWIAIPNPRNATLDDLAEKPFLREVVWRLPDVVRPQPVSTARLLGVDAEGRIVHDLFDPDATKIRFVTSVQERGGKLYLGSLVDEAYGVMERPR